MSNTSIKPRLRDWFPRLLSGQPHQIIGGPDDPYMLRWYVIPRNPGRYDEITEQGTKRRHAGSIAFRPAEWRHRVQLIRRGLPSAGQMWEVPCWTVIVTGRRARTWGFWCPQPTKFLERRVGKRFIKWDEFGDAGCGEPQ